MRRRRQFDRRRPWSSRATIFVTIGAAWGVAFLGAPLGALTWRTLTGDALGAIADPLVGRALVLSGLTTAITLVFTVALGTPLAYLLARHDFRGRGLVELIVDLPMVLPPAVAGLALLMTFGRRGVLGPALAAIGWEPAFTTSAVILAQCFVAAPLYVRSARAGFAGVDPTLERVASTLGAPPGRVFWRVTVPLARPALLGGAVLAWARALGEFGATIMFAGNFSGRTQTMPLAIYQALETNLAAALTLAWLLVVVSAGVLALFRRSLAWTGSVSRGA